MVSDNNPHLSKGTLELKSNETYEKTPFQAHLLMDKRKDEILQLPMRSFDCSLVTVIRHEN